MPDKYADTGSVTDDSFLETNSQSTLPFTSTIEIFVDSFSAKNKMAFAFFETGFGAR